MDGVRAVETNAEVLAIAHAAGFTPSEKQRKDWRRFGLLTRDIDHPGAGKGRGSVALYPAGTGALLTAICRRSAKKTPLRDVAVLVWWDGYRPAAPDLLRALLRDALDGWDRETSPWRDMGMALADRPTDLDRAAGGRLPGGLQAVRHRVGGPVPFAALVATLHHVAAGSFQGFPTYHRASAEDAEDDATVGLGLEVADWLSDNPGTVFRQLAATLHPETLRRVLRDATDADLDAARDECRMLDGLLGDTSAIATRLGYDALRPFTALSGYTPPPRYLGVFIVWWLSLRRFDVFRKGLDDLRLAAATVGALRRALDATDAKVSPKRPASRRGKQEGSGAACAPAD